MKTLFFSILLAVAVIAQDSTVVQASPTVQDSAVETPVIAEETFEVVSPVADSSDSSSELDLLFPEESDNSIVENDSVSSEEDSLETTEDSAGDDSTDKVVTSSEVIPEKQMKQGAESGSETPMQKRTVSTAVLFFVLTLLLVIILFSFRSMVRKRDRNNFLTRTRISIMDREVQLVCRHIEQHYADPTMTADSVCEALSTGKQFVETLFHKELDMTIEGFINHVRIHHAVSEINSGYEGEAEPLMKKCGYEDQAQFEHDFFTVTKVKLSSLLHKYN